MGEIRTHDFMDLQSIPLNHSSTIPLVGGGEGNRTQHELPRRIYSPLHHLDAAPPDINIIMFRFAIILLLCGCTSVIKSQSSDDPQPVDTAVELDGLDEKHHRAELKALIGVDPRQYEWCAAFVNSILQLHDIPGSESVSEHPLLARGFLDWGIPTDQPEYGDIVILTRGRAGWQGHVGFYIDTIIIDGVEKILVLGGNQNNQVGFDAYNASRLLGFRKIP